MNREANIWWDFVRGKSSTVCNGGRSNTAVLGNEFDWLLDELNGALTHKQKERTG